jgi:hypothetical protein
MAFHRIYARLESLLYGWVSQFIRSLTGDYYFDHHNTPNTDYHGL